MKRVAEVIWLLMVLITPLFSGYYAEGTLLVPGSYRYGRMVPDTRVRYEWWFDQNKLCVKTTGWNLNFMDTDFTIQLNRAEGALRIINGKDKTYVTGNLNTPVTALAPKGYEVSYSNVFYNGEIRRLPDSIPFLKLTARRYHWHIWLTEEKLRTRERKRDLWIAEQVPFDWTLYRQVLNWLRGLVNLHRKYPSRLQTLKGFVVKMEEKILARGGTKSYRFQINRLSQQQPDGDIFKVPVGYKKKQALNGRELWLLQCVFLYPRILR